MVPLSCGNSRLLGFWPFISIHYDTLWSGMSKWMLPFREPFGEKSESNFLQCNGRVLSKQDKLQTLPVFGKSKKKNSFGWCFNFKPEALWCFIQKIQIDFLGTFRMKKFENSLNIDQFRAFKYWIKWRHLQKVQDSLPKSHQPNFFCYMQLLDPVPLFDPVCQLGTPE